MMGVWIYEYWHICSIVNMKRTEENLSSSLLQSLLVSFLLCMPGWLVWWHTGFVLSLPPIWRTEVADGHTAHVTFTRGMRIQTRILLLAQQTLFLPESPPQLSSFLIKNKRVKDFVTGPVNNHPIIVLGLWFLLMLSLLFVQLLGLKCTLTTSNSKEGGSIPAHSSKCIPSW